MALVRIIAPEPINGPGPGGDVGPFRFIDGVLHFGEADTIDTDQWTGLIGYANRHGYTLEPVENTEPPSPVVPLAMNVGRVVERDTGREFAPPAT